MEFIEINDLRYTYPERNIPALDGVSLKIKKGEFITLCGKSGCGKSTLLRRLKPSLSQGGELCGAVYINGRDILSLSPREECSRIGFAMQSPDDQLVCDKVWHELAFGLESLGLPTSEIRARVAETAEYFGIADKFDAKVAELSGGQKQLVNLAAVMVMRPELLILDEPTAQLDPIAAAEHIAAIGRLNRELGVTVILAEHRLEEAFAVTSRVIVMDNGKIVADGTPKELGGILPEEMYGFMPTPSRVWRAVSDCGGAIPTNVRDGRLWLEEYLKSHELRAASTAEPSAGEIILRAKELHYRYEGEPREAVRGLSLDIKRGEIYCILGGNGSGKSTALSLLTGVLKPSDGEIVSASRCALLPQDPTALFCRSTVREELSEMSADYEAVAERFELGSLYDAHPYDLSGGERQRLALAKVMLRQPDIILADEPTKGMDHNFKQNLIKMLRSLCDEGRSIVLVSHDAEFCAEVGDRCGLFFDGAIVTEAAPREFFTAASYYTTAAARMSRGIGDAVTAKELISRLGGELSEESHSTPKRREAVSTRKIERGIPMWRRITAGVAAVIVLVCAIFAVSVTDLTAVSGGMTAAADIPWGLYTILMSALVVLAASLYEKREPTVLQKRRRITPMSVAAVVIMLIIIPLTVYFGGTLLGARRYYITSLLVALETLGIFALMFEAGKPKARELALIASLCAIGTAGRALMFMLPECKPVVAVTVIAGAVLGGGRGFTVGAMTMLVSNLLFGQGPWTPWQMLAMGLVGLVSGAVFRFTRPTRLKLCIFGALAAVIIYGGIMNPASVLMWAEEPTIELILTYYVTGLPIDLVRGVSTAVFLWFAGVPMLEKLSRVREKYGL